MTDIRQHLPVILPAIRRHLAGVETLEVFRINLRELLPASYGIGAGRIVNSQGQQSRAFDVIIYDTTINPAQTPGESSVYDVRQVLAVIVLAHEPEVHALQDFLHSIASVKILRLHPLQVSNARVLSNRSTEEGTPKLALKKLLPLGIVAYQSLLDTQSDEPEALALHLDGLLKEQPEHLRPDYLLTQRLMYYNPLLTGGMFEQSTLNIAREPRLQKTRPCYVCKQSFSYAHFFYHSLCLGCGDLNYQKRSLPADLSGRIAMVTGARVKIGYATALRLLRAGAQVIVTTRFPHDAAIRYSSEPDFTDWQDRLHIYGLDFRYLPTLEHFVAHLYATYPALDILINNAAQTVRRPLDYYAHLLAREQAPLVTLTSTQQALVTRSHAFLPPPPFTTSSETTRSALPDSFSEPLPSATLLREAGVTAALSPLPTSSADFPAGLYDEHQQQVDLRSRNSWMLPFNEIDLTEFLEVQIINVTAPFLLVSRLHTLMKSSSFAQRFIVNVSAVEGQFANAKFGSHVHTNMAKASLNMLTHTAAAQLARDQIFMNSVDPGWISQQSPLADTQNAGKIQRLLPLDLLDAAARICDPIFLGVTTGEAPSGRFYKDYQPVSW